MSKAAVYRLVPGWNAAFKVQEDCCYEKVVYQGEIGMTAVMDHHNELNGILLCGCDPHLEILPISERQYLAIVRDVNLRRAV